MVKLIDHNILTKRYHKIKLPTIGRWTPTQFIGFMKKLTRRMSIEIIPIWEESYGNDEVSLTGSYDPEIDKILLFPHMNKNTRIDRGGLDILLNDIIVVSGHESMHRKIYHDRDFEPPPVYKLSPMEAKSDLRYEYSYYGSADEIEAYAYDSALDALSNPRPTPTYLTQSWQKYQNLFGVEHRVFKKYITRTRYWYNKLKVDPSKL